MKPGRPEPGSDHAGGWLRCGWRLAHISGPVERSSRSPPRAFPGLGQACCGAASRGNRRGHRSGWACRPFGDPAVASVGALPSLVDCPLWSIASQRQRSEMANYTIVKSRSTAMPIAHPKLKRQNKTDRSNKPCSNCGRLTGAPTGPLALSVLSISSIVRRFSSDSQRAVTMIELCDSPLEGDGFEPLVPRRSRRGHKNHQ